MELQLPATAEEKRWLQAPGGGYSQCGLTGGSSQFEGFTEWLPNDAICQPNTTNWRYS